jgi:hypothetical protein
MIVERVTETLMMATIIVIMISGNNGFVEIMLRLYFVESAITTTRLHHVYTRQAAEV